MKMAMPIAHRHESERPRRVISVRLDGILANPAQPRERATIDEREIAELAATMERHGLLSPIAVAEAGDDTYTLIAGQRRLLAARHLGWGAIEAIVVSGNPRELALIENIQRVDLHPIDLAEALAELVREKGWTHEDAAAAIGKARSTVSELLALAFSLYAAVKAEWRACGKGSKSQLIALTTIKDPEEQYRLWEDIRDGRAATVAATREQKHGAEHSASRVQAVLRSGWRFIGKLKKVEASDWPVDQKPWRDLLKLRRALNTYCKSFGRTSDEGSALDGSRASEPSQIVEVEMASATIDADSRRQ